MLAALLKFRLLFCFFIGIRSLFLVVKKFNISEGNPEVSFPNKKASSISNFRENKFSFPNFVIAKTLLNLFTDKQSTKLSYTFKLDISL